MAEVAPDYGTCPCTGRYERRLVEVRIPVGTEAVTLRDIPQGACPVCGSRVYKSVVLDGLERVMRDD
jgi:YgiT-type zinc finger domain-containing protein